jgi:hypothetical protein
MHADALKDAISVERHMTSLGTDDKVINVKSIITLCHPLIRVDELSGEVTTAHESVRDFMLRCNAEHEACDMNMRNVEMACGQLISWISRHYFWSLK